MDFKQIVYEKRGHKAYITLNRPEVLNAFSMQMQNELKRAWADVKQDRSVHVVILTGSGDRAFCSGVDRNDPDRERVRLDLPKDTWHIEIPGSMLASKQNGVYKPVITAVNGICSGGGFYFLYDSDITICSENATFFDPHVTYGQVAALEPVGMLRKIPLGEVIRIALMGMAERVGAQKALQIGLVTEITPQAKLMETADQMADVIAGAPPMAIQGTLQAIWHALETGRASSLDAAKVFVIAQNVFRDVEGGEKKFQTKDRPQWRLR
jgi:enoyl-CoA hydratase/carnithine racemase